MKSDKQIATYRLPLTAYRLRFQSGMTLIELLVASILIGIVMIGAFSFSQAIKQIHQSTDRSTIPAARVAAAMAQIMQDASSAVGDGLFAPNPQDHYGIASDDHSTDDRFLCFQQDDNDTPENYGDDSWACYSHTADHVLRRCVLNAFGMCANNAPRVISLPPDNSVPEFYTLNTHSEPVGAGTYEQLDSVVVTLTTRIDPGQAEDPMSNPQFSLTTTINPWGQGR